jgi:alpha,alpha-trehalase
MLAPHALRQYALIADGERGALVGPGGEIAWMCFPGWADEGVFASLLGADSGYLVQPRGRFVWGGSYEPGTLIWRSRWVTEDAIVECREALALPSRRDRAVVLRRIEALEGTVTLDVRLRLQDARHRHDDDGTWRGKTGATAFAWQAGADARADGRDLAFHVTLESGQSHDLVLVLGADAPPVAGTAWAETEAEWARRVPDLSRTAAPRDARHAVAVLSGLTSSAGGMVAAATTGLPERAEQGRNYDYRYAWIRDQCLAGRAFLAAGCWPQFDATVEFIRDRILSDGPRLAPAYTVDGGRVPDEHRLGLPGYPGGTDLAGNRVNEQFQLDGFGEALLVLAAAARNDRLDRDGWRAAGAAVQAIGQRFQEADAGVWELEPRKWTHSRLTVISGLRAVSGRISAGRLADAIAAEVERRGVHPSGRWQRAYDDPRVDAALLLPSARAAFPPGDPRHELTLRAVEHELGEDGYTYRYKPDERPLGEAEGAFLLCGFALSLALHEHGDEIGAVRAFERNRSGCGPPALLAEEFDVQQRQLRGNLPQAFVHALLLECAVALA